jgi:hypothetical protein
MGAYAHHPKSGGGQYPVLAGPPGKREDLSEREGGVRILINRSAGRDEKQKPEQNFSDGDS